MTFHGFVADKEFFCNFTVVQTNAYQSQHFSFPGRQTNVFGRVIGSGGLTLNSTGLILIAFGVVVHVISPEFKEVTGRFS